MGDPVSIKAVGVFGRNFPIMLTTSLLIGLSCLLSTSVVESVAAATEWPLSEEYTMAILNITFRGRNGSMMNERTPQQPWSQQQLRNKNSGRFGKGGKIGDVSGVIVHVKSYKNGSLNPYGCGPIVNDVPHHEPWIALVKRGQCDYDVKMENALAKNAAALVVYDREDSETLQEMKLSSSTIPGVFIYKTRGERIANLTDAGIRVEMQITVGEVCSKPYTGLNRATNNGRLNLHGESVDASECVEKNTSVLFVSISFIVLMVISLAWLIFYYIQRFRYLHAKDRLAQRLCNAAKKALAKIPTRSLKLTDQEAIGEAECCAVCIDFYKAGDMLRTLPCRHEFHKLCVDPWLLEHRTCPMCKMDILKHYGYIFTGSQESILHLDLEDGGLTSSSDSRDTDSSREETQQIHTHHQHHRIHHHPTDSLSISSPTDEAFSSIPDDHQEYQIYDESPRRKPSLVSLTVTATSNGLITTTATTTNTTSSPPPQLSPVSHCTLYPSTSCSSSSDCLVPSRLSSGGGCPTPTTTTMLASIASPDDSSKVITSLVNDEFPHQIIPCPSASPSTSFQSSQPLLSPSSSTSFVTTSTNTCSQGQQSRCPNCVCSGGGNGGVGGIEEGMPICSSSSSFSLAPLPEEEDTVKKDQQQQQQEFKD